MSFYNNIYVQCIKLIGLHINKGISSKVPNCNFLSCVESDLDLLEPTVCVTNEEIFNDIWPSITIVEYLRITTRGCSLLLACP